MNYKNIESFCSKTLPIINSASDGNRVLSDAECFVQTDKWNNFSQFHKTHSNIASKYSQCGLGSGLYEIPTGSNIGSGRWIIQQAEDVLSATLDMTSPDSTRLADFKNCPWAVIQWTASTPPQGITAPVTPISNEDVPNLKRNELAGRFALLSHFDFSWPRHIARAAAAGVIVDMNIPNYPDASAWTKFGWGGIGISQSAVYLPGMVISGNQGKKIRKLIADGVEVKIKMKISARHYSGSHEMAWGLLEGGTDPQQEIWAISHSAEPGAIDNASGVATCIEALRILKQLVDSGKIAPPRRSIRMLSGYECYSFFNYLENQRRLQTPLAGACVDSVGARAEYCGGRLEWHRTIPMSAGFVNRTGRKILNSALKLNGQPYELKDTAFVSTLDTLIGDPKYGFPCPWMTTHHQKPRRGFDAYHSSADTIDLLWPRGLATCASALASYCYYLANASEADMFEMAKNETSATIAEIKKLQDKSAVDNMQAQIEYLRQNHHTTLQRLRRFALGSSAAEISSAFNKLEQDISSAVKTSVAKPEINVATCDKKYGCIPVRKIPVTPTIENSPEDFTKTLANCDMSNWILFWADGKRDIRQIASMASCEYGRNVEIDQVYEFFKAHAKLGYVELIEPQNILSAASILKDLKELGIKPGMNLLVHSSLSAIGFVDGGAEAMIEILKKAVGKSGTVMAPTFNHMRARVYNPATTPGLNGAIAEALWKRPESFRSDHTTHSIAATGKLAEYFCSDHTAEGLWTANSPLGKLMAADGYVLCLGVDQIYSTHYHLAEVELGSCIDPKGSTGKFINSEGCAVSVPTLAYRNGQCPSSASEIGQMLDKHKLRRKGFVGKAESTLVKACDIYAQRIKMLEKHCPKCSIKPEIKKHC